MYLWNIYLEEADSDTEARFIGTMEADTQTNALMLAAQFYERPEHDLVARHSDQEKPILVQCPYCQNYHQAGTIEQCPKRPRR
jgi:L-ribulose-5-phosphate 3-epimerase UlaE